MGRLACTQIIRIFVVTSDVQSFRSSLATTGRRHPCSDELLTFKCEVVGSRLDWRVDSVHRARYSVTDRVDEVRTVNGPSIKFRTLLTDNKGAAGSNRRLTSILIAEPFQPSISPHNISCSSDSETQLLQVQVAGNLIDSHFDYIYYYYHGPIIFHYIERPRQPLNLTVAIHPDHHSLTLQWDAPANIDKFDIEHYTIQALSSENGYYELNVTGSELEYPFGVIMNNSLAQYESSNLTVSAISKCSQQGSEASAATITVLTNVHTNNPMYGASAIILFNSNGNALYAIALLIATLMIII